MPVRYSDLSAGPMTRRADGVPSPVSRETVSVMSSSQMSKAALQALAAERGLATSGSKNQLLDRLSGVGS